MTKENGNMNRQLQRNQLKTVIRNYFYDMLCELFKTYKEELIHKLF